MRESGHVDRYKNLRVNYIDHHNPDLVLFAQDGSETHRVDLTRLSSTQSIHKLCQLLGLKEICRDENSDCPTWSRQGECQRNADYMATSCRKSCKLCGADAEVKEEPACRDQNKKECPYWATMGECDANPTFMNDHCPRSCGLCPSDEADAAPAHDEL